MSPEAKAWHESWEEYTKTEGYLGCVKAMRSKGMVQPYIDNIMRRAFDFAFTSAANKLPRIEKIVVKKVIEYRKEPPIIHPYKKKQ